MFFNFAFFIFLRGLACGRPPSPTPQVPMKKTILLVVDQTPKRRDGLERGEAAQESDGRLPVVTWELNRPALIGFKTFCFHLSDFLKSFIPQKFDSLRKMFFEDFRQRVNAPRSRVHHERVWVHFERVLVWAERGI